MIIKDQDDFIEKLSDIIDSLMNIEGRLIDEINESSVYDNDAINDWRNTTIQINRMSFIPYSIPEILNTYVFGNKLIKSFTDFVPTIKECSEFINPGNLFKAEQEGNNTPPEEFEKKLKLDWFSTALRLDSHLVQSYCNSLRIALNHLLDEKMQDLDSFIHWCEIVTFSDYRCINIQKRVYEFLLAAKDFIDNEVSKISSE